MGGRRDGDSFLPKSMGSTARKMRTMKMDDRPGFSLQIEKAMSLPQSAPTSRRTITASTSGHDILSLGLTDLTSSREKRWCCDSRGARPSNGVGKVQGKRQINLCKYGKKKTHFQWLKFNVDITDQTGSIPATVFAEKAGQLYDITAAEMVNNTTDDNLSVEMIQKLSTPKKWVLILKASMYTYVAISNVSSMSTLSTTQFLISKHLSKHEARI